MRIISGIAKGKKIFEPIDKQTRPLKDMVRESIFNIILHSNLLDKSLEECLILDLFSGVGSFGLEAISRGAKKVVFYEDYGPAINLLTRNIDNLSFYDKTEIKRENVYNKKSFKSLNYNFDIVFIDPPFKEEKIKLLLSNLIRSKIINTKTLIIIHRNKKKIDEIASNFKIFRQELYGSSKIIFGGFIP